MGMKESILEEYYATRDFSKKAVTAACYAPFVSIFFDTFGNARACCQNGKYLLGNVAEESLLDIWHGKKTALLRKALTNGSFAAGCQFCEWQISVGNYLGTYARVFERWPVESATPEWPSILEFSISNTCNLECIMCYGVLSSQIRQHREKLPPLPKAYGDRFFNELRQFLPHLKFAKFLGGEPFLAAESYRIWDMMIEDGLAFECHVTTNGTQYNDRVQRVMDNIPLSISMSMDGATKQTMESIRVNANFDEVRANLERFHAYCRQRGTCFGLTYCLMRQNWHEFGDYLLFADSLDCGCSVNTVREPPHCSLYTLPVDELSRIADELEKQGETLVAKLGRNRHVWETQVQAIRLRVTNQSESSRSPFNTPLSLIVLDAASLKSIPDRDRMTPTKAAEQLRQWSGRSEILTLHADKDDRVHGFEDPQSTFLGIPQEECVGDTFEELVQHARKSHGEGQVFTVLHSGHYVDRMIDYCTGDGDLTVTRIIAVPTVNEYEVHSGSTSVMTAFPLRRNSEMDEDDILASQRWWSGDAPLIFLQQDCRGTVTSIDGPLKDVFDIEPGEWLGKPLPELRTWLKRFGMEKHHTVWKASPNVWDRVMEFRAAKQLFCVRILATRRFSADGKFQGWYVGLAGVPITAVTTVKTEEIIAQELTEWSGGATALRLHYDLFGQIADVKTDGGDFAGMTPSELLGKKQWQVFNALRQRHGQARNGPDNVNAHFSDRRFEFATSTGPLAVRFFEIPHFDVTGKYKGTLAWAATHSAKLPAATSN
jgi:MoaA/NifB/PqqE/SkfB family radical SAM enzyme